MDETQTDQEKLKQEWNENLEVQIQGKRGHYKIIRNKFLGRGGFGIVHLALRRYESQPGRFSFQQVVIKEYKKSQKWKNKEDWDKELVIMQRFAKVWDDKYILKVIDIFQYKANRRYYMVTTYAAYGTLFDRIKLPMEEKHVNDFIMRSAEILKYLHYDLLKDYQSSDKDSANSQPVGIIHRDFKPANIVYLQKDNQKSMYLIDFGIAKVGYTQLPKVYSNCGTNNYKAPQMTEMKQFNAKVDIYSFGCTLYQIFSGGQRLIGSLGLNTHHQMRERYVRGKILDLHNKLILMPDKIKTPSKWIEILTRCLQHDPRNRWSSKDLYDFMDRYDRHQLENSFQIAEPTNQQRKLHLKKENCELNFQIYRINIIQDIVFQMFEYFYFKQPKINKFTIYSILKFVVFFIIDKFNRAKERARLLKNQEKAKLVKRLIDDKKLQEIRDKATQKIKDEISRQRISKGKSQSKGPIEELCDRFPQILKTAVPEPRRVYYQICYQLRKEILDYPDFANMVILIVLLMDDYDSYADIRLEMQDLKSQQDPELLSARKLYKLKNNLENRIKEDGISSLFDMCQVEMTVRSNINKDEIKSQVPIAKRSNIP